MTEKEISCHNCQGACCSGGTIELSLEEASFMIKGGNKLKTIVSPVDYDRDETPCPAVVEIVDGEVDEESIRYTMQPLEAGLGRYIMTDVCKYLKANEEGWQECSVYDDRPYTCQRFEVGGSQCKILRQISGIDEVDEENRVLIEMIESSQSDFKKPSGT